MCGSHFCKRGMHSSFHRRETGCRWEEGLLTQCPPTWSMDACWKYCLPTHSQKATRSPGALVALSLTSTPRHNHLTAGPTLLLLTILSDFSHFFIWAQSLSSHGSHPPGNLLLFLCQFSSPASSLSPPSTSHFSSQTSCWINYKHQACLGLL